MNSKIKVFYPVPAYMYLTSRIDGILKYTLFCSQLFTSLFYVQNSRSSVLIVNRIHSWTCTCIFIVYNSYFCTKSLFYQIKCIQKVWFLCLYFKLSSIYQYALLSIFHFTVFFFMDLFHFTEIFFMDLFHFTVFFFMDLFHFTVFFSMDLLK